MHLGYKTLQRLLILCLVLLFAGCAQPILRPVVPAPAEQSLQPETTSSAALLPQINDVPQTTESLQTTELPQTEPPQTAGTPAVTQPPVTAPPSSQEPEITGGGELDLSRPPVYPTEETEETEECTPSVLMYHLILEEPYTELVDLFVRPSEFEDHLQKLCAAGCQFLFADAFEPQEQRSVILTFDDGYVDNYTEMFPILKKYGARATVFMIAGNIGAPGYLTEDMIREMAASGLVQFASHTLTHSSLTTLSPEGLEKEFSQSAQILCSLTGKYPKAICYPGGTVNAYVREMAAQYYQFGYTTKNSADTSGCDPMAIPRVRVSRGMSGDAVLARLGW